MNIVNRAFRALKQVFRRRERECFETTSGRRRFSRPFVENLEDRTLPSSSPPLPADWFTSQNGTLGDATAIAVVNPESVSSLVSFLGYSAQFTGDHQLTVFASGDIDFASLQPDFLQAQGIRS